MILFDKLIRIDLLLLIAVVVFFILKTSFWHPVLPEFISGLLFISRADHMGYYKRTKKLY